MSRYCIYFQLVIVFTVCVKFMKKFVESLDSSSQSDQKKIEAQFRKTCEKSIKDDNRLVSSFDNIYWAYCIVLKFNQDEHLL